ncbi:MAG: ferrous iron transporter B [Clostridia bacterium]|nr:ferrous iron transporter B [Clostridia bacterium]
MKRFALAGNPNCGKTTLFNGLTGSTAHVGNWPGVTVDKKEGFYKKLEEPAAIIDLPGIYSLSPYTPEEVISRNYILDEKPECVINIVDATNLERNLYLTTQLMEIDVPVVVALNMIDVVEKNGDKIDLKELQRRIGLPVVAISALKGTGYDELMTVADKASRIFRKGSSVLMDTMLDHLITDVRIALEGNGIQNPLFHAVKLIENDELEVMMHPSTVDMIQEFKKTNVDKTFGMDYEAVVADGRYRYITDHYSPTVQKNIKHIGQNAKSAKVDRVLTHRIWGIPIFLVILFAVFHLTFSENFLFLGGLINDEWVSFSGVPILEDVLGEGAINSPGVIVQSLFVNVIEWLFGLVGGLFGNAPLWLNGLINDGILAGLSAVLGFVPLILTLYLFLSILEDSGYMARVAFILDKPLRKFGLSGRAFLPMIMGFGCSVPAMANTRTLADQDERTATVRVIPFFSCGAKLPILTAVAGAIMVERGSGNPELVTYSMYLLGIAIALISTVMMKKTTMRGEIPPFIMELPSYRLPMFKNLMLLLWDKAKHFIKKAFTIIVATTIVVWFLQSFTPDWQFIPSMENADQMYARSILATIGQIVQPLFTPMGFGSQLGATGWVFVVAAVTGLIAKENVIATFGALGACVVVGSAIDIEADGGVSAVVAMIDSTGITTAGLVAFIAFNMLTIPCFAAVATAKGESPTKKIFRNTVLFWLATSYAVSTSIYLIGTYWWTCFIIAAIAIGATVITIKLFDRKEKKKALA